MPVVASLSGEDIFLERLEEPFYSQARREMRKRAADVDAFVALNRYYADFMARYLEVDPAQIHVIPHGLNHDGHGTRHDDPDGVFTIGYLARICPDQGLHNLVAGGRTADGRCQPTSVSRARGGYLGEGDRPYWETIQRRVTGWKNPEAFGYLGEVTRAEKIAFLQSMNVMSLPTEYHESKGLSVFEAAGQRGAGGAARARNVPRSDRTYWRGGPSRARRPACIGSAVEGI